MSDRPMRVLPFSGRGAGAARCCGLLLVASALQAGGCVTGEPPVAEGGCLAAAEANGSSSERRRAGATVDRATIYVDLSHSMAGFLGDRTHPMPVTPLQQLLRAWLREGVGKAGIRELRWVGFGRELVEMPAELADYSPARAPTARSLFRQEETNVIAAFDQAAKRPGELAVVVTDNAQDLLRPDGGIALGFDRGAMIRSVTGGLVDAGFGVWLLGVRSEFSGAYFSVQLAAGPRGATVNRVLPLRGHQPLLLWIFSRDLDKGRRLVSFLHDEIASSLATEEAQEGAPPRTRAIELAPGVRPAVRVGRPEPGEIDARRNLLDPLGGGPGRAGASRLRDFLELREWREAADVGHAAVTAAIPSQRTQELLFLLKAHLSWPRTGGDWDTLPPELWRVSADRPLGLGARVEADLENSGGVRSPSLHHQVLSIDRDFLRPLRPRDWKLAVPLRLEAPPEGMPAGHWLRSWSTTDDTSERAIRGKALYLWEVTRGILERSVGQPEPGACLDLTIVGP